MSVHSPLLHTAFVFWLSLLATWGPALSAPPTFSLIPFRKIEADPARDYTVTGEQGPWMIMAFCFSGTEAEAEARKLALELRRDFQLQAFVHKQQYDYSQAVQGLGVDKYGKPKKMKFVNSGLTEEWAVLIGNFRSADDPDANRVLERVRTMPVKSLSATPAQSDAKKVSINFIRDKLRQFSSDETKKQRGPLGKAFLSRNPLLPADQVAKGTLDPFVKELNQGLDHTLLENRGRYTVQIATFRGVAAFNEREFNETTSKHKSMAKIDEAALKATKIVRQLRQDGVEAYVFHDRFESIVTVGSFNDLGTPGENGRTELLPEVAAIVKKYEANRNPIPGSDQLGLVPKLIANTPLDASPRIIQVPRENLADVYGRQAGTQ